jgi:hypothetical protein
MSGPSPSQLRDNSPQLFLGRLPVTPSIGLLGMACWIGAYPFGLDVPAVGTRPDSVAAYAATHRASLAVFGLLVIVGAALVIGFLAGLRHDLASANPASKTLLTIGFGAGVATQTVVMLGAATTQAAAVAPLNGSIPAVLLTLFQILFVASAWPTVVMNAAYGLVHLAAAWPARWAGWLSLITAAVHVPAGLTLAANGFWAAPGLFGQIAPGVFIVWVVSVSAALLLRPADRHPR